MRFVAETRRDSQRPPVFCVGLLVHIKDSRLDVEMPFDTIRSKIEYWLLWASPVVRVSARQWPRVSAQRLPTVQPSNRFPSVAAGATRCFVLGWALKDSPTWCKNRRTNLATQHIGAPPPLLDFPTHDSWLGSIKMV